MNAVWVSTAISVITLLMSIGITLVGAGIKWGQVKEAIRGMEGSISTMATKEEQAGLKAAVADLKSTSATKDELAGIKESLAEIKGMFVLRLKE